jgi:hypothetical protein
MVEKKPVNGLEDGLVDTKEGVLDGEHGGTVVEPEFSMSCEKLAGALSSYMVTTLGGPALSEGFVYISQDAHSNDIDSDNQ